MFLLQLIILLVVICGGLIFILRNILTKDITSSTAHLDALSIEFSKREQEIKDRQAETEKYCNDLIAKAKEEADRVRQEADKQAQAEKDKILESARVQGEQIILKAENTKEMITEELRQEMESKVTKHIGELLCNIFPKHIQESIHKLWVLDLISGSLSRLSGMRIPEDIVEIKLVSAFPLSPQELKAFKEKFKEQLKKDFSFKEELDPSLIGGVLISMGSLVLDGTIASKIQNSIREYS